MEISKSFKNVIQTYLENRATQDSLFAITLAKENKNIEECCIYILENVKESNCNGFADEEIFGMAVHYYDEDSIKVGEGIGCRVVVNHVVELTEEEKLQAKQDAIKMEQMRFLAAAKKKAPQNNEVPQQMSLF